MGGRRRRLRAHRRDAAAVGPARGGRGLRRAALPRASAGGARAAGGPGRGRARRRGGLGRHDRRPRRARRAARRAAGDARRPHAHVDPARPHPGAGGGGRDAPHADGAGPARAARRRDRGQPGGAGAAAVAARARRALAAGAAHRAAGRPRRAGRDSAGCRSPPSITRRPSRRACPRCWRSADNLYGGADPAAAGTPGPALLRVRRTRGEGTSADSEFELAAGLARRRRRPPGAGQGRRRAGDRRRRGAAAGGAAVGAAAVHGHRGPSGRRRPVRHVRPRPRGLDAMTASSPGCAAHAGASAELRALARTALDRIEPVLDRLRIEPPTPMSAETCAVCPLCALMAALRGERPELVQRLAEQLGGLVTRAAGGPGRDPRARPDGAHVVGQPEDRAADPGRAP